MTKAILTTFLLSFTFLLSGQYAMNLGTTASPQKSLSHKVGHTIVEIVYSSPSVRGRDVFGELVPFGEVWRAGANRATTLSFSEDVTIKDQVIPKDTYALFILPQNANKWTLILNKVHTQWGAFDYSAEDDFLRLDLEASEIPHHESLNYEIQSGSPKSANILLQWADRQVDFEIKTRLTSSLASLLKQNFETLPKHLQWIHYLQAADILLHENEDLSTARNWIDISEKLSQANGEWNNQYYPKDYILQHLYWTKAKLLNLDNDKIGARSYIKKMRDLKGGYYKRKNAEIDNEIMTLGL